MMDLRGRSKSIYEELVANEDLEKKAKELDNLEIPIDFKGHEQDIEVIKDILSDLIKTEEEKTEFDHNNFDNLEVLKELKEQLK